MGSNLESFFLAENEDSAELWWISECVCMLSVIRDEFIGLGGKGGQSSIYTL